MSAPDLRSDDCLGEELLAAFAEGVVSSGERERCEAHIDACAACRTIVSGLASAALQAPHLPEVVEGAQVGRYVLRRVVGVGAWGIVFEAYDPKLDRKVAVKLVRDERAGARERLEREAQLAARLQHPNVVSIHDVGTIGDQVYIAMEYVHGATLAEWIAARKRTVAERVAMFLQAARGLAAAHAAGLVHRDFKPSNVLIGGDGRLRVADFGLARPSAPRPVSEPEVAPRDGAADRRDPRLTMTGAVVGSPAYMAPEQHRGERPDARGDQFSFCVAFHEAIYGVRPFPGTTIAEVARRVQAGKPVEPPRSVRAPAYVRRAILRGLSLDPAQRFPSMEALIEALDRGVRRRRRVVTVAIAAAAAVAAALWSRGVAPREATADCADPRAQLAGTWDRASKEPVRAALLATRRAEATDAWTILDRTLSGYLDRWAAMRTEVCAGAARGEPGTVAVRDCLDDRVVEVRTLVGILARGDAAALGRAAQAGHELTPLASCREAARIPGERSRAPTPVADPARVMIAAGVARLHALVTAGLYATGMAEAPALVARARALGQPVVTADALLALGVLQRNTGDVAGAEQTFHHAAWTATAGGADALAAVADVRVAELVGQDRNRFAEAFTSLGQAQANLDRLGGAVGWLEGELHRARAELLLRQDRFADAKREAELALALLRKHLGDHSPQVGVILYVLGGIAQATGHSAEALDGYRQALAVLEAALGPRHPRLGPSLDGIANVEADLGHVDLAIASVERSLAVLEPLGDREPRLLSALVALANLRLQQDRPDDAIAVLRRALASVAAAGHSDLRRAEVLALLGEAALAKRDLEGALAAVREGQALRVKVLGPGGVTPARSALHLARIYHAMGRRGEAEAEYRAATAALPEGDIDLIVALAGLGALYTELGAAARALPPLERASRLCAASACGATDQAGEIEFYLARALWELGRDRPRARQRAVAARARMVDPAGHVGVDIPLAKVDEWLATHRD